MRFYTFAFLRILRIESPPISMRCASRTARPAASSRLAGQNSTWPVRIWVTLAAQHYATSLIGVNLAAYNLMPLSVPDKRDLYQIPTMGDGEGMAPC
jgi:hypothetical protein